MPERPDPYEMLAPPSQVRNGFSQLQILQPAEKAGQRVSFL
jgi:hypothetical protein